MKSLKTQVEVKYTTLLNYSSVVRPLVSSLLSRANINITNIDTSNEIISLSFNDGFDLEIRWDRLVFVTRSDFSNLIHSNGPLKTFFDLLVAIIENPSNSFGKITNFIFAKWDLLENNENFETNLRVFNEGLVGSESPLPKDTVLSDIGTIVRFSEGNYRGEIVFGPYNAKNDINEHRLYDNVSVEHNEYLDSTNGYLLRSVVSIESNITTVSGFNGLFEYQASVLTSFEDYLTKKFNI